MDVSDSAFPARGCYYFWFLNDECRRDALAEQVRRFTAGGAAGVCLHARQGLLVPYAGDDWFEMIAFAAERCIEAGLDVWLYDEDYCPSGVCGGWITAEHPEYTARTIECFEADAGLAAGEPFCFPTGRLLWAGLVPDTATATAPDATAPVPVDLTSRVGTLRREWTLLDPWDSRWYYPATPLYKCPRSWTTNVEFGLIAPAAPAGMKLVAFVARPYTESHSSWGAVPDPLNPEVTRLFIERTHERYARSVGTHFGRGISAVFTDEPKYHGGRPYTPGMFEAFRAQYGYELTTRLLDLFTEVETPSTMRTRLDYREWCRRRFEAAWLAPVAEWCHSHGLRLVGHISPEDDPVQQANCVSNLFPLHRHFDLTGLDLIVPAVGDSEHPLLNIGIVSAVSAAQQLRKAGVMSESLACSGLDFTSAQARRILFWQTVMGLTTPVIHGAFQSTEGMRLYDAPPDFGPNSTRWEGMQAIHREIVPAQETMIGARQVAPVAVLWPIRTFMAGNTAWQPEPGGRRGDLAALLLACLEHQVGVHLLDEETLWEAEIGDGRVRIGWAEYAHILIPPVSILHERTLDALAAAGTGGVRVAFAGEVPAYRQTAAGVEACDLSGCDCADAGQLVTQLPSLVTITGGQRADVRCSAWARNGRVTALLTTVADTACTVQIDGCDVELAPGCIVTKDVSART